MSYTFLSNNIIHNYNANGSFTPVDLVKVGNDVSVNTSTISVGNDVSVNTSTISIGSNVVSNSSSVSVGYNTVNTTSTNFVNMPGGIAVSNTTVMSTVPNMTYIMDLTVQQTLDLPAVETIPDGYNVIVRVINKPSGFMTAYIRAQTGKTISYRDFSRREFYLIGGGETFRFTWLQGLDIWIAECLIGPSKIYCTSTYAAASYGGGPTSWSPAALNLISGPFASNFSLSGYRVVVPIIAQWAVQVGAYRYAAGGVAETAYLIPGNASGSGYDTTLGYDIKYVPAGTAFYTNLSYTTVYDTNEGASAWILSSTSALYYYYYNTYVNLVLTGR